MTRLAEFGDWGLESEGKGSVPSNLAEKTLATPSWALGGRVYLVLTSSLELWRILSLQREVLRKGTE